MTGIANFDAAAGAERNARLLGALRILLFGLWIYTALSSRLGQLALLPLALLEPVWILRPVPTSAWQWFLTPERLTAFQLLLVIVVVGAAVGIRPYRLFAMPAAVLVTFDQALKRSWGYGDHPELLLLLATYAIAAAPAADRYSWPRRRLSAGAGEYGAAILFIATIVCFTYLAPAAYRAAHHALASVESPTLLYAIVQNSFRTSGGEMGIFFLERPALADWSQAGVPVATLFELTAPLALLSRTFRRLWLPFPVIFHTLSGFVIAVPFWETMIIAVAALIALDRMAEPEAV